MTKLKKLENGKIILEGVFTTFDTNRSRSNLYYTKEEFDKHLKNLEHDILLNTRRNKINKIRNVK